MARTRLAGSVLAGQQTRTSNRTATIDFDAPRDHRTLGNGRSFWIKKVWELVDGTVAGKGEWGAFFLLGEFSTATGARAAKTNLIKSGVDWGYEVTFHAESVKHADGTRTSELWAAVGVQ